MHFKAISSFALPLVERPTLAYLERLWEKFAGMTEAEKLEYSQPSDAKVTRKRKLYFQDLASPDTVVLDRVLQENRSRVMYEVATAKICR